MKKATFKDWTLTTLEDALNLKQIWKSDVLAQWEHADIEITIVRTVFKNSTPRAIRLTAF